MYFVSIKVLDFGEKSWKSTGICLKVLEKSWNKAGQSPGKTRKMSWKVLESPGKSWKVLESPGKSWNLDYVFLWQP